VFVICVNACMYSYSMAGISEGSDNGKGMGITSTAEFPVLQESPTSPPYLLVHRIPVVGRIIVSWRA
jgi:hypothetical protein